MLFDEIEKKVQGRIKDKSNKKWCKINVLCTAEDLLYKRAETKDQYIYKSLDSAKMGRDCKNWFQTIFSAKQMVGMLLNNLLKTT